MTHGKELHHCDSVICVVQHSLERAGFKSKEENNNNRRTSVLKKIYHDRGSSNSKDDCKHISTKNTKISEMWANLIIGGHL